MNVEPLPNSTIGKIVGLLEVLDDHGGREDIYKLARELKYEFGELLTVLKAAEMVGFVHTPGGDVEIVEPVAYRNRFGTVAKVDGAGASLKGLRLSVPNLDALESALKAGGVISHRRSGMVFVPPETAFGATLIFEPSARI